MTGLKCLRTRTNDCLLRTQKLNFGFHWRRQFYWLSEQLLPSYGLFWINWRGLIVETNIWLQDLGCLVPISREEPGIMRRSWSLSVVSFDNTLKYATNPHFLFASNVHYVHVTLIQTTNNLLSLYSVVKWATNQNEIVMRYINQRWVHPFHWLTLLLFCYAASSKLSLLAWYSLFVLQTCTIFMWPWIMRFCDGYVCQFSFSCDLFWVCFSQFLQEMLNTLSISNINISICGIRKFCDLNIAKGRKE